jgi:cytochrome oxidase Cu insertion factor (SCO1/SenC/PrrC family)
MKRTLALALLLTVLSTACGGSGEDAPERAKLEPGDPAPGFSLPTASGDRLDLADLRGRPALFYFSMGPG